MDMDEMTGFEERFAELVNGLCVVLGGIFMLFGIVSVVDSPPLAASYATVAIAFLLFPLSAGRVFTPSGLTPLPPPIIKKKK